VTQTGPVSDMLLELAQSMFIGASTATGSKVILFLSFFF